MTTKRRHNIATGRTGVNYVRNIVEKHNSIFQEVEQQNDIGNDAYIEFISDEESTGCCIAAQIKSGNSFRAKDEESYILKADKDHFEYWNLHVLPVVGIVYDPISDIASWVNISQYLEDNPNIITDGPFDIRISKSNEFASDSFANIKKYFIEYTQSRRTADGFARTAEIFLSNDNSLVVADALKALFYFNRNRICCWHLLISSVGHISDPIVFEDLTYYISLIPGHGDIYWHKDNFVNPKVRKWARNCIKDRFSDLEVVSLLSIIDEFGISRGTIGQCVHAIIRLLPNRTNILKNINQNSNIDDKTRWFALLIYLDEIQITDAKAALKYAKQFLADNPDFKFRSLLRELISQFRHEEQFHLY
jgi:hypothetical protein